MTGTYNHPIAQMGRGEDNMVAHVAKGEQYIPKPILDANPELAAYIAHTIRRAGADPRQFQVGSDQMSINPQTGLPEFGLFKSIKKIFKAVAPIASIAAMLIPGGQVLGASLGTISKVLGAANAGMSLFGGDDKKQQPQQQMLAQQQIAPPVEAAQAPEFTPARPDALARPQSLNELSAFSPEQERSALATRGMNQGLGDDENKYYRNLLQRSLIGDGNQVQGSNDSFLMPIESQYFSQQGQNTSNLMEFLKGIQG